MIRHWMPLKALKRSHFDTLQFSLPSDVDQQLCTDLVKNEEVFRNFFQNCSDVVFRPIPEDGPAKLLIIYVDGLVDTKVLNESVLKPLMFQGLPQGFGEWKEVGDVLHHNLLSLASTKTASNLSDVVDAVLRANVVFMAEGHSESLIADLKDFKERSVEEPSAEISIRGPREGFTENLRVNTSLLRRRLYTPRLKMESLTIGTVSKSNIIITYLEGIVSDSILHEVRNRLSRIQIDAIFGTEYLEEFIEDSPSSPFPQIQNTERPDVVASSLLEGKVAILAEGSPFALIAPMTFWTGIQAAEDYYERYMYTTFIRWIRMVLLNMSLFLPSFYVAIISYHAQLIPTALLISIAAARDGVPFPTVVEGFLMEFMFEGLREAGIRLPKPVGQAVSIVGALVIGQAAVQAGIVSAPMVIVVSVTGIASFTIPRYNFATAYRMLRFPLLLLSGLFGLYGLALGAIAICVHLVNLRSFGVPYLSPVTPLNTRGLKDVFIRAPRWSFNYRPAFFTGVDKKRVTEGQKPSSKRGK